ncbi:glycosyltransferase family 4 protein [Candidatus Microgenomates bacterium]|nr:glycosyltransferase family 4 protein [Candidatus Microgenomates bacterium]
MKLGIDARLISQTGVGVYTRNLLYYLQDYVPRDWEVNVYLKKVDYESFGFGTKRFNKRLADIHWHTFSEQTAFYKMLQRDNLDLMHFTYFSYPAMYRRPFVSTIHDLTPLLYKTGKASTHHTLYYEVKHMGLKLVLSELMRRSAAVITPSNAVRGEILQTFGARYADKVVAIYEGLDESLVDLKENEKLSKQLPHDFFVYVGNFYPHKNVEKLVEAYRLVDTKIPLILVGPEDHFAGRIQKHIESLGMQNQILVHTKSSRNDLVYFYNHAKALIHPSLAEGFGLTLLEAAFFGCPIIASDIPVIREMLGDEYVAFDPLFTTDMTEKIEHFIEKRRRFDYKKIVKKYSFDQMAKETVEVYKKVVDNIK